jgi:predicted CXXCH cytochrome family protein
MTGSLPGNQARSRRAATACLLSVALLAACGRQGDGDVASTPPEDITAQFVGGAACVSCHTAQAEAWSDSQHDLAMQVADESTVRGNFDSVEFVQGDVTSTFFRRDGRFMIRTDGADGQLGDFAIEYVFGIEPLQQYLVALPGGRLQALGIAWDTRPADAGGQRWFHLYGNDGIAPGDPLHWTGRANNWNAGCAECHSTNLAKHYDVAQDTYATTWTDIDVNCEACHGPGSEHAARPAEVSMALGGAPRTWVMQDNGIASRAPDGRSDAEIEACAQCHARRSQHGEEFLPGGRYLDAFRPALLEEGLYEADGQILEEVYVYGSFMQSRMQAAGVTCSDCHDPHSTELRADGNAVCGQCHLPARFGTAEHHHHEVDGAGAQCVGCHMPARTYMVVDPRRDHSFRVPRPDLTSKTGSPNACNACHDETTEWAEAAIAGIRMGARRRTTTVRPSLRPERGARIAARSCAESSRPRKRRRSSRLRRSSCWLRI